MDTPERAKGSPGESRTPPTRHYSAGTAPGAGLPRAAEGVLWTRAGPAGDGEVSIPVECAVLWAPPAHLPPDVAVVCAAPPRSATASVALLCHRRCLARWSAAGGLPLWRGARLDLSGGAGAGAPLPVLSCVLSTPLGALRWALGLLHDSLAAGDPDLAAPGPPVPPAALHARLTIGDYVARWTQCPHVSHVPRAPAAAPAEGRCAACCCGRMRALTWDLAHSAWDDHPSLLEFERALAPLGALLGEVTGPARRPRPRAPAVQA